MWGELWGHGKGMRILWDSAVSLEVLLHRGEPGRGSVVFVVVEFNSQSQ